MKVHNRSPHEGAKARLGLIAGCIAVAVALPACSSTGAHNSSSTANTHASGATAASTKLANLLPASIRNGGVITVASLDDLPPWDFKQSGKYVGIDVDLTDAMGKLLGVRFDYQTIAFAGQLPGLAAHRFDLIIDEIGDTVKREAAASFVDYTTDSNGIIVQAGNPKAIQTLSDLCGKSVEAVSASLPLQQAQAQSTKCTQAGSAAVKITQVRSVTAAYLAVASGRADATLNGYSTAAYAILQGGITKGLALAPGAGFQSGLNGIAYAPNNPLGSAIQAALNTMMQSGQYAAILKKWNVTPLGLPAATINSAAAYASAHPS
jgi:polar amino acid transport system substrate-binding protein